jgi:hypothetical protein
MSVERELEIIWQRVLGMIHEVVHDENVPGLRGQILLTLDDVIDTLK